MQAYLPLSCLLTWICLVAGHTAYGEAYGLVLADLVPEFLLFLYGQSHHVCESSTRISPHYEFKCNRVLG